MVMFSPHVYCLQIFICVGLCMSLYLCVHDIGVCRGGSPCAYMSTFLPISLFICVSGLLYSHMHALLFIHLFLHLWLDMYVCVTILMSVGACVRVSLHKSVCMRTNVFGRFSGWMHLCVHVQVFMFLCAFEDSVYRNFPYVFCYVSAALGLCMPLWYRCPLLFACIHMTIHTRVCATVCLWRRAGLCHVGAYLSVCVEDMHACVPMCLCVCPVYLWVSVSICTFTWNVFTCVNLYRCTCTSFGVDTFVRLHGCESMYFSVSVYMPVSLWI